MEEARYKPAAMQNDGILGSGKPPPPLISERFREMVRDREEELRVMEEDGDYVALSGDEIVRLYDILLSELSVNSKPIITDLTIIAGEQRMHGAGIADAICGRIVEVPVEQKLPSLYLLDSIVKNIGREYIRHFSARLPEVFCEAYKQVHPNMHSALRHLFGTWSTVFPVSVLRQIESNLQFSSSADHQSPALPPLRASESPRPAHGIHVNPKYLEARRQFGHETADPSFQPPRGVSTTSKLYTQKHSTDYEEFYSDDGDTDISLVRSNRYASSSARGGPVLSDPDVRKLPPTFGGRIERPSSPFGVGHIRSSSPALEEWRMDYSPGRLASPLDTGIDYGFGGVPGNNNRTVDRKRNFVSGDSKNQVRHPPAVRFNNGVDVDRTRALIDAYGIDKRTDMMKHPNVEELRVDDIETNEPTNKWQNSEEEEFDWENMSPTLADRGRKDVFSSSLPPSGSCRNTAPLASHLREDWANRPQFPAVNGSSVVDVSPSINGLKNTVYGIRNGSTRIQGSFNPQESWKLSQNANLSSTHQFNATNGGNNPQMPFPGSGILPPPGEKKPSSIGYSPDDTQNQGTPFGSRGGSVSLDYMKSDSWTSPAPASVGMWPSTHLHGSHGRPMLQTYQPNRPIRGQLDTSHSLAQDMRHHVAPPASNVGSSPLLPHQSLRGYAPGHLTSVGTMITNPYMQSPMPNTHSASTRLHGLPLPLPRGIPGALSSHMLPHSQPSSGVPNPRAGGDFSNLFSSLMAQGVISLNQTPKEDPVGLEFNADLLKVRHESAITSLYSDLPRQCTTCGLRFKLQEAHSSHMDWHVTKNRVTRNRKQKPSRKWFVSISMWLTGTEALGTDSVPNFLPSEDIVEKKDDEELAVPADDDQKFCALCGEPFDDYFCDERDEWMYKGAVYMNAPSGSTADMDRSLLGPIVHAKCRSETGVVSEDIKKSDLDFTEECSQRKRMRI